MGKKERHKKSSAQQSSKQKSSRDQQVQRLMTVVGIAAVAMILVVVGLFVVDDFGSVFTGTADLSTEGQPTLGADDAPVEVVEFADFKCPACAMFNDDVFPRLKSNYIDTGQVRFSFLNFPLPIGQDSWTAANAVECVYHEVGNQAFWAYYHAVFANQGPERQTWATPDLLVQLAADYVDEPVDTDELRRCIVNEQYRDAAEHDRRMGANAEIPGTPTVFVNGQKLRDFRYSTIASAIDQALQEADAAP